MPDHTLREGMLLHRVAETGRRALTISVDGEPIAALEGDTVLTAILSHRNSLRVTEFEGRPRAGFCLMGACHDCMVWSESGVRLRACSTEVVEGLRVVTKDVDGAWYLKLSL